MPSCPDDAPPAARQTCLRSALGRTPHLGVMLAFAAQIWLPAPPAAAWQRVQEVVRGSADTLEKGRLMVGIFAPVMVGVTDNLTVASHPILDLLLVPNLDVRYRLVSEDAWILSLYGGWKQGFQPGDVGEAHGQWQAGAIASRYLADRAAITAGIGWSARLEPTAAGTRRLASGLALTAAANLLLDPAHLVMLQAHLRATGAGLDTPLVTGAFVFIRGIFQFAVGASYGSFVLRPLQADAADASGTTIPVFPYVDIWWDF